MCGSSRRRREEGLLRTKVYIKVGGDVEERHLLPGLRAGGLMGKGGAGV